MKRLRVFGHATVTVSTVIEVSDDENLTEELMNTKKPSLPMMSRSSMIMLRRGEP